MAQLSQTASHPDFLKVSNRQFRNITTQAQEGLFNARRLRDGGVKTVAVIGLQNDRGLSATGEFTKALEAAGGKVTTTELFNPGARDVKAISCAMIYEEGALILQQARQLNISVKPYSASPMDPTVRLQQAVNGLSIGLVHASMAIGCTLIFGVLNVVNFAHGEVYTVGALIGLLAIRAGGDTE